MKSGIRFINRGLLLIATLILAGCASLSGRTAFDDYIAKPDPAYEWNLVDTIEGEGYTAYVIDLTSQRWLTEKEVDRPLWKHWLTIVKPEIVEHDTGFLMIGGGSNRDEAPTEADALTVGLALGTNSVVSHLGMVPNQPIKFVITDQKDRSEDDLIAYGWDKFLVTGDPIWLARLPMVKSAVRAMDTIEEFMASDEAGGVEVDKFVVAGGSKRGWTTWMTGVADKRVKAIVPIVIDMLNVRASFIHHYSVLGFWSPAIGDYVNHKIMERMGTPEYADLLRIVDPYSYLNRLKMPKFMVNAAGDQFFLPDSWQFYFDDLKGEKYIRYVPNADHGLGGSDAVQSVETFYHSVLNGTDRPKFEWEVTDDGSIRVETQDRPKEVNLWQATNPETRDFRLAKLGKAYKSTPLEPNSEGVYIAKVAKPAEGFTAFFVELVYESGGRYPFKFTSGVKVVPDILPFTPPASAVGGGE